MPAHLDSPADSSTSRNAAILSHDRGHQHSSSFPFIKSLNPFKPKPSPTPRCPERSPAKPYEVAPGIWSTDATAKVFGYLDTEEDNRKTRSKSAGPDKRHRSRDRSAKKIQGSCSPARKLYERYKEAHTDDGLDDFRGRTHRRKVEEWDRKRQERRDEAKKEREESERRGRRGRMLTVGKEDELVSRGANPRTGVVTPWEGSEESGDGGSWLSRGRGNTLGPGKSRESSGKWTQEENGWSLVQDPGSSPARQGEGDDPVRDVSVKEAADKFIVNMPGVGDPDPPSVTAEEIRFYQEDVERAYRKPGGSHGLEDPETVPTPRAKTPEGPSTPPSKLHKIKRKAVGRCVSESNDSTDTVLVHRQAIAAAAISPTIQNIMRETPSVKVVPPSPSASPLSKRSDRDHRRRLSNQTHNERPFLGPRADEENSPTANVTPSPCLLSTPSSISPHRQMEHGPEEVPFVPQQLFRTLSQYLPPLSFLHPSHFANLPASYQNPTERLPEHRKKQMRDQDASTITTPISITTTTEKKQRPRVGRLDGTNSVPRANLGALEGQRKWWERQKKPTMSKLEGEKSKEPQELNPPPVGQRVQVKVPPAKQSWEKREKGNGRVANPSADDPKALISDEKGGGMWKGKKSTCTCICLKCRMSRFREIKGMQTTEKKLEPRSGYTIGEHVRKSQSRDGVGCIPTDDRLCDGTSCDGNEGQARGLRMRAMANELRRKVEKAEVSELEVPLDGEAIVGSNAWCGSEGRWEDALGKNGVACVYDGVVEEGDERKDDDDDDDEEGQQRLESALAKILVGMWNAACEMEKELHAWNTAQSVCMRVVGMVQHVLLTLKPASPALRMLRKKDARVEDYVHAVRDLMLAGVYVLVLLNLLVAVGRAVRATMHVLLCAWWPVKVALSMVRWLALGSR